MAAPDELLNLKILAYDQSGNLREAIWTFDDDSVPNTVKATWHEWHNVKAVQRWDVGGGKLLAQVENM